MFEWILRKHRFIWKSSPMVRLLSSSVPPQRLVPDDPIRGRPVRRAGACSCVGLEHGLGGGDGGQGQSPPAGALQPKLWRLKTSDGIGRDNARGGAFLRLSWLMCGAPGTFVTSAARLFAAFPDCLGGLSDNCLCPSNDFQWLWSFPSLSLGKGKTLPGDALRVFEEQQAPNSLRQDWLFCIILNMRRLSCYLKTLPHAPHPLLLVLISFTRCSFFPLLSSRLYCRKQITF